MKTLEEILKQYKTEFHDDDNNRKEKSELIFITLVDDLHLQLTKGQFVALFSELYDLCDDRYNEIEASAEKIEE